MPNLYFRTMVDEILAASHAVPAASLPTGLQSQSREAHVQQAEVLFNHAVRQSCIESGMFGQSGKIV